MILMVQGGAFALVVMGIAFVLLLDSNGVVLLFIGNRGSVRAQDDVVAMSRRSCGSR